MNKNFTNSEKKMFISGYFASILHDNFHQKQIYDVIKKIQDQLDILDLIKIEIVENNIENIQKNMYNIEKNLKDIIKEFKDCLIFKN